MKRGARQLISGTEAQAHPALEAWCRLPAAPAMPMALEVWRETRRHQPASIYRFVPEGGARPPVFAKRCDAASFSVERTCYEEIFPRLDLSAPAYFGSLGAPDGTWWVFVEDVGQERLSPQDPAHRILASRWLARLHRLGAQVEGARQLPPAGPPRYLTHVREARVRIERSFSNPCITGEDRHLLSGVLALLDRVEGRWAAIERVCAGLPETVVHGDFRPKNVRIREDGSGPVLYALDWETAGWGVPVADLAPARDLEIAQHLDPEVYAAEVLGHGPPLDVPTLGRLTTIGFLFRRLAAIDWESVSLHFEVRDCLVTPLTSLRSLCRGMSAQLANAEEWLA